MAERSKASRLSYQLVREFERLRNIGHVDVTVLGQNYADPTKSYELGVKHGKLIRDAEIEDAGVSGASMKPTIGRIVIIHQPDGEQIAAIVTKVHTDTCINCSGFIPNGNVSGFSSLSHKDACGDATKTTHWDWPART